ncbi:hypothetical protein ACOSQ2_009620 [Xanthoceras sorbifolium]
MAINSNPIAVSIPSYPSNNFDPNEDESMDFQLGLNNNKTSSNFGQNHVNEVISQANQHQPFLSPGEFGDESHHEHAISDDEEDGQI